jgi:hypothetical protein
VVRRGGAAYSGGLSADANQAIGVPLGGRFSAVKRAILYENLM